MFEPAPVADLDPRNCADALADSVLEQRRFDARRVAMVNHWADLHPLVDETEVDPSWTRLRRRTQTKAESYGADGTPAVSEFAATELGLLLQTTTTTAGNLLRDSLDLRHRHPKLYQAVLAGTVELWQARQVARSCARADLSLEQARWVDLETVAALKGLPFGRALTVVEGKIIAADPEKYEQRRHEEEQRRYVSIGRRSNDLGLRTLVAQSTAGDVARFYAMVSHLADLMLAAGDTDPAPVRRAKALALLANPAMACVFLAEARATHDQRRASMQETERPHPTEPHVTAADLGVVLGNQLLALGPKTVEHLRPKTVLYLHLAEEAVAAGRAADRPLDGTQVVRSDGLGALSVEQLKEWLHTAVGVDKVVVKPVIDSALITPVDCYEVPAQMRGSLELAYRYEVFPYGTRASGSADADHTIPYVPLEKGGPPGQTRLDNLGPLGRHHHRAKTFGGFVLHQPLPGMYLWRTPTGHWFQVDILGTHSLGRHEPEILRQRRRPPPRSQPTCVEAVANIQVVWDPAA